MQEDRCNYFQAQLHKTLTYPYILARQCQMVRPLTSAVASVSSLLFWNGFFLELIWVCDTVHSFTDPDGQRTQVGMAIVTPHSPPSHTAEAPLAREFVLEKTHMIPTSGLVDAWSNDFY